MTSVIWLRILIPALDHSPEDGSDRNGKIMSTIMIRSRNACGKNYFFVQASVTFFTRSLQGSLMSVKCSVFLSRLKL